ncbi:MAG: 3-isopropylmalate dehydratase large subunit [Thermodesulfobacteriota bacterium]|nr:3-isopropylmalate dehydratase large subunit [Thermodesulfobacteriota bacterium]
MGMTIIQKILAHHAGQREVESGQIISCKVDIILGNDITAPIAIEEFKKAGAKKVYDRERVVLVSDHFVPNKDIRSANQAKRMEEFAKEQGISHYYGVGDMGIEHVLLPEKGIVLPGDLVIGADSHTCTYGALGAFSTGVGSTDLAAAMISGETWLKVPQTMKFVYKGELNKWVDGKDLIMYTIGDIGVDGALYKTMEFAGEVIKSLPMAGRLTMANMAIEAGAKSGIIVPDSITEEYVKDRAKREYRFYTSDKDATYCDTKEYDVSKIEPQVAFPHLPENVRGISEAGDVHIDQVFIGSCTNGKLEDLRVAAQVLKGKRVAPYTRLIVIPATQWIYKQCIKEGLLDIFIDAKAAVSTPTCGPCLGGHMGVLAKGERAVATTNRNFIGRMGDPESEVYLTNPAIAAASAVLGRIGSPEEL